MKSLIIFSCVVAMASAGAIAHHGLVYSAAPVLAHAPLAVAPVHTASQYHSQDELGQYSYGYAGGPSSKAETKTADGITRGSYSYVDANGLVQTTNYISDPVNGFRVAATNLPVAPVAKAAHPVAAAVPVAAPVHVAPLPQPVQDTPEVIAARAAHFQAHAEAAARAAH